MSKVILRQFDPATDSGFIYSSFPKGVYHGSVEKIATPKDEWFGSFYNYLKEQLALATVSIACMQDDPDTILGYSILAGDTLQFVYVKAPYRNQGIATLLTKNKFKDINVKNLTKVGAAILAKHQGKEDGKTNE